MTVKAGRRFQVLPAAPANVEPPFSASFNGCLRTNSAALESCSAFGIEPHGATTKPAERRRFTSLQVGESSQFTRHPTVFTDQGL